MLRDPTRLADLVNDAVVVANHVADGGRVQLTERSSTASRKDTTTGTVCLLFSHRITTWLSTLVQVRVGGRELDVHQEPEGSCVHLGDDRLVNDAMVHPVLEGSHARTEALVIQGEAEQRVAMSLLNEAIPLMAGSGQVFGDSLLEQASPAIAVSEGDVVFHVLEATSVQCSDSESAVTDHLVVFGEVRSASGVHHHYTLPT